MEKQYVARYNKVWQNLKSEEIFGDKLTLKDGEKLTDYQQIPKPKDQEKKAKPKTTKSIFDTEGSF